MSFTRESSRGGQHRDDLFNPMKITTGK